MAPADDRSAGPPSRSKTIRDELRRYLRQGWTSIAELSALVGVSEKTIPDHLEHLRKSASGTGNRLEVAPATCNACGFTFESRKRLSRPSRCPNCKSERIDPPRFRVR